MTVQALNFINICKVWKIQGEGLNIPKPHKFVDLTLESSTTMAELIDVVKNIDELLPQLAGFIARFNQDLIQNNLSVIYDSSGNMSIDVRITMPSWKVQICQTSMRVIDNLILTRSNDIELLIYKGWSLEDTLKNEDPNFTSQILKRADELRVLKRSYSGHIPD